MWYNSSSVKKLLLAVAVIIGSIFLWNYAKPEEVTKTIETIKKTVSKPQITSQTSERTFEFVPYWSFTKNLVTNSDFSLIYFGVAADDNGIDTEEEGYKKLKSFVDKTPNASERIIAVRMLDKEVNAQVLKDTSLQEKIASQAVSLAVKNDFDGILLDYETSAFGFDSTTNAISDFYRLFSNKVKASNLLFYVSLYGDAYYRARPFDVKSIGEVSDKVLIMAYDFSKSRGNPGPNFPLLDNAEYGYDFGKMIDDFQQDVDNQKIVVIFGYFGYDWKIDKNGESVASGVPISTNEIVKEFVEQCEYDPCSLNRDPGTLEPSVRYGDDDGVEHMVWYEDAQSIEKKKEFLKEKGILETAAWAYSYY